jgi:hypothetical protein
LEATGLEFDCFVEFLFDFAEVAKFDLAASESLLAAAARFPFLFLFGLDFFL